MTALLLAAAIVQGGLIFANGFEEGSACAWSNTPPCAVEGLRDHAYSPPGSRYWNTSFDLSDPGGQDDWNRCWPEVFCALSDGDIDSVIYGNGTWDFLLPPSASRVTIEATAPVVVSAYTKGSLPGVTTWVREGPHRETMLWTADPVRLRGAIFANAPLETSDRVGACVESATWGRCLFLGRYEGARAALERAAGELAWTMTATPHWTRTAAPGAALALPPVGDVLRLSNLPLSAPSLAIYEVILE